MYLTLWKVVARSRGSSAVCKCRCGSIVTVPLWEYESGHKKTCGSKECTSRLLAESRTGKPRPDMLGKVPPNKLDRTGIRYGKLVVIRQGSNHKWICRCDCGNECSVLSTNLANYARNGRGCRHCANRKDISGERIGLLVALEPENGALQGRHPLWTFKCDCGGTIQGTVREFHAGWLRSCGCHDNAYASWASMMARCYDKNNNRYSSYGRRGITVCKRWHSFSNFIQDMGERPKRHNLGRRHAEKPYSPNNCFWEHISKNCRDTKNDGMPTKPGLKKGAKPRKRNK